MAAEARRSLGAVLRAIVASDLFWSFRRTPMAVFGAVLFVVLAGTAVLAPVLSPQNPYDLAQIFIDKAELPPIWAKDGEWPFLLGTDPQGRDVLSTILYGTRISLLIGLASVLCAMAIGVTIGLAAGYFGGWVDNVLMRLADTVLSIPTLLVAILVSAVFKGLLPPGLRDAFSGVILVGAISLTGWVQYARTVRASTMVERRKEYVLAAQIIGVASRRIMRRHILPNALTPVLVAATLNLGLAILSEATLSFLGVGMPVTKPSLGTLIRVGNQYLFSGSWWVVVFPAVQLGLIVLAVNLVGDWLRDALNPRLR
ncbi:ABC transporter permease [uncultured Alsobacter sp.]|uniref:ABC transporter permease n=1 Tax=uncultured Alsobacter sp. TaxID=1748258 RepID=UPI0025E96CCD|nr:ABC transporter permease [uncultured Alsobacter sp.]